jgi:hypothetical protein
MRVMVMLRREAMASASEVPCQRLRPCEDPILAVGSQVRRAVLKQLEHFRALKLMLAALPPK